VKDASVADNLESLGGSIQWNVSFFREAHDCRLKIWFQKHRVREL